MTPFVKNLVTALGVLTVAYAGYYFYTQQSVSMGSADSQAELTYSNMLTETEVFIARSQDLNSMDLDVSVLDDARFRSLRAFTRPVEDQPAGRENPFSAPESTYISSGLE